MTDANMQATNTAGTATRRRVAFAVVLLAAFGLAVFSLTGAARAANCDGDRKLFPKDWKSVAGETQLFTCAGRYVRLRVFLTQRNDATMMLTVANDKSVYRAIVDVRDTDRIKKQAGLYILNSEKTCFIRGNYSSPAVLSFAEATTAPNGFNFFFAADALDVIQRCEQAK